MDKEYIQHEKGGKRNTITMPIIIVCYFILCFSYAIRGELNFFGNKLQFAHHFMQFIVSTTYFTIAYTYMTDNDYDEDDYQHIWDNPRFIKVIVVYLIMVALLSAFYIIFKRQNALVS